MNDKMMVIMAPRSTAMERVNEAAKAAVKAARRFHEDERGGGELMTQIVQLAAIAVPLLLLAYQIGKQVMDLGKTIGGNIPQPLSHR